MRTLGRLIGLKNLFGNSAADAAEGLLRQLLHTPLRVPDGIVRLHETVLYLRAYPQSREVLRLCDEVLSSFDERTTPADVQKAFEDPDVSGAAGTSVSTSFSHPFAKSLVTRHGSTVRIDWENFDRPDRMGPLLARVIPAAAELWSVEPHVDWHPWFEGTGIRLRWLIEHSDPQFYDQAEIPLRWDLGRSRSSRSRLRLPRREVYYHQGPLLRRRDVSLEQEFRGPRIGTRLLKRAEAERVAALIVDASATRYRELWGFLYPDLARMRHADLGRGVDFFFFGVAKHARLPLREYHAGMFFKNGVAMGYFEGLTLFERMEAGFNLYYTFRDGETAWLYARVLKVFREQAGVTCFSIDPYQIGDGNEEAIESGAFWFYYKLGFRPAARKAAELAAREARRIERDPAYRTSASVLRELAKSPLFYGDGSDWAGFSLELCTERLAKRNLGTQQSISRAALLRLGRR
jgi:hypothetical protein